MSVGLAQRSTYWTEDPQGAGHLRGAADAPGPVAAGVPEIRQVRLVRAWLSCFILRHRAHVPTFVSHLEISFKCLFFSLSSLPGIKMCCHGWCESVIGKHNYVAFNRNVLKNECACVDGNSNTHTHTRAQVSVYFRVLFLHNAFLYVCFLAFTFFFLLL